MIAAPVALVAEQSPVDAPLTDQPAPEIVPGVYHSRDTDFVGDSLTVESWFQNSYLISGKIQEQQTLTFQVRVMTLAQGDPNHFVGDGSLVYGSCSWPMKMEVFSFVGKFYVQSYIPYPTFGTCGATDSYVWRYNTVPFKTDNE